MDEEGRLYNLLRQLFEEWRKRKYSTSSKDELCTENDLLFRLDLSWRIRRLHFLTSLIDEVLLGLSNSAFDGADASPSRAEQEQREYAREIVKKSGATWKVHDEAAKHEYFEALTSLKHQLNKA